MTKLNAWLAKVAMVISVLGLIVPSNTARAQAQAPAPAPADAQTRGVQADLAFETSEFMRQTAYRNVSRLDTDDAPDGAYGAVNRAWDLSHQGQWYIEEQRSGADLINGGLSAGDPEAISRGLHILQWGFRHQNNGGSFSCPDSFHSTSFFVEACAHSCLLIQASPFAQRFAGQIATMTAQVQKSALWMVRPDVEPLGRRHNQPFTHRRYLVACALGETGVLCQDKALIRKSEEYIREGLALQDPSGFNPERDGYDSSYNAVGLFFAERYCTLVAGDDVRAALRPMLEKGIAWEASRINPDGTLITTGNTRVGGQITEAARSGQLKKPAVGQVFRCLAYWSQLSGENSYAALADKVAAAAHMSHLK